MRDSAPAPVRAARRFARRLTPGRVARLGPGALLVLALAVFLAMDDGHERVLVLIFALAAWCFSVARLVAGRRRLERVFDATLDGVAITQDGRFVLLNRSLAQLLGHQSTDELIGQPPLAFAAPSFRDEVSRRVATDNEETYEAAILRADGTTIDVEVRGRRFSWRGRPARLTAIRDVTERRRAADRLEMALDTARMAIWEWDVEADRVQWTGDLERVAGASVGDGLANTLTANVHPDDLPGLQALFERAIEEGLDGSVELRLRPQGDRVEWLAVHLRPIADEQGAIGRIVGVVTAITERRLASEALEESEARYRTLVENANEMVFIHGLDGTLTTINEAAHRILGYGPRELVGAHVYSLVAEEDRDRAIAATREKLDGESEVTTYEVRAVAKDGRHVPVEVSSRLILEQGVPVGVQSIARDVTSRKALEEQLQQSQKLEAVGRLAGGVAHDFNNLLTAIEGYSGLLLEDLAPGDPRRHEVEEIRSATERAAALTRQLLAVSRRQVLQPTVLDLNEVVTSMESLLRRLIGEDVALETRTEAVRSNVKADRSQLEQVLLNLAVNSRDAMIGGGRLLLRTEDTPEGVALVVVDTGVGIEAHVRAHVFEPFFTTKPSGSGNGLGLATVYGIVAQTGGTIEVESEPGSGASFRIVLPVEADGVPQSAAPAEPPVGERPRGTETVLLVEDEETVRQLTRQVLERSGYRVVEASDGIAAEQRAGELGDDVDLLLTDVIMPGMTGPALAERLVGRRPGLRVLFTSGYAPDVVLRLGLSQREVAFLPKPFTPETLSRKVREVLDQPVGAAA